jgi:hypothetical protein
VDMGHSPLNVEGAICVINGRHCRLVLLVLVPHCRLTVFVLLHCIVPVPGPGFVVSSRALMPPPKNRLVVCTVDPSY